MVVQCELRNRVIGPITIGKFSTFSAKIINSPSKADGDLLTRGTPTDLPDEQANQT